MHLFNFSVVCSPLQSALSDLSLFHCFMSVPRILVCYRPEHTLSSATNYRTERKRVGGIAREQDRNKRSELEVTLKSALAFVVSWLP